MGMPAPAPGPAQGAQVDTSALAASILARMGGGAAAEAAGPSLAEVLRPETLIPLARSPDMLERLAPHMPEEHRCGRPTQCPLPERALAYASPAHHPPARR